MTYVTIFRTRDRRALDERVLLLTALGYPHRVGADGEFLLIDVKSAESERARLELLRFRAENPPAPAIAAGPPWIAASPGILVYAFVLVLVDTLARWHVFGVDWERAGSANAGLIQSGEWWRCVTALTLHADVAHLFGNLMFGSLFGMVASHYLGPGLAWLVILLAGALGTALNAALYDAAHVSIGASTAVFAAWGLISVLAWQHRRQSGESRLRRWAPLGGGLALLAFLGAGDERTDILGHLSGFVVGCLAAPVVVRGFQVIGYRSVVQRRFSTAALALVLLCWVLALN